MTGEFTEYIADHLNGAREENAVIGAIDEGRFNGRPLTQEEQDLLRGRRLRLFQ